MYSARGLTGSSAWQPLHSPPHRSPAELQSMRGQLAVHKPPLTPLTPTSLKFMPLFGPMARPVNQIGPCTTLSSNSDPTPTVLPDNVSLTLTLSDAEEDPFNKPGAGQPTSVLLPEEALAKAFSGAAEGGLVRRALLPRVLCEVDPRLAPEAVDHALQQILPVAVEDNNPPVTFEQALAVYHQLLQQPGDKDATSSTATEQLGEAKSTDSRSLCQLLITVVGVMFTSASVVAGLAILWLWMNTAAQNESYTAIELHLNSDLLDVMVHDNFRNQTEKVAQDYAMTVSTLVQQMGYELSNSLGRSGLDFASNFLGRVLNEWYQREAMQSVLDTTLMLKVWVGMLLESAGLTETCRLINLFNNQSMPDGYELLVGQWRNGTVNGTIRYLTTRRFRSACVNGNCSANADAALPLMMALWGYTGIMRADDYRPKLVQSGYVPFPAYQIGMIYKVDMDILRNAFHLRLKDIFDRLNAAATDSKKILLARTLSDGTAEFLTTLPGCPAGCAAQAVGRLASLNDPMALALRGQAGQMEAADYLGVPVIAAYRGLPAMGLGLVVQVSTQEFSDNILSKLGKVLKSVNDQFTGTVELELASLRRDAAGNPTIANLTEYRFAAECRGGCNVSAYFQAAALACSSGVTHALDYRGKMVTAGYTCLADLGTLVAYKRDDSEIDAQGLALAVQSTDQLNSNEVDTSFEMQLGRANPGVAPQAVRTAADFQVLSKQKFSKDCRGGCTGGASAMASALAGYEGILYGPDYRGTEVMAATTFVKSLLVGLVAKVDQSELMSPIISTALLLIGVTLGSLLGCTFLLALYTRQMVLSMIRAEGEGQAAIRLEQKRFSTLVESMYPAYVIPRVLAGERQIVQLIPHTAVFFSDIYDFTTTSNKITSEELLELMGYTYGVMDTVADHYCVTKVKTVGDAYLAIAGLPGNESRNCCLDMLRFASCVAQAFSCKFDHPSKGEVLSLLSAKAAAKKPQKGDTGSAAPSERNSAAGASAARPSVAAKSVSSHSDGHSLAASDARSASSTQVKDPYARVPKVRCLMSYGIAAGPVTAGVLQGKNPMFDIWGKTVNLASRMQSTGQPGRIQVSDLFYRSVIACPGQRFVFEPSRETMCKGFGMVKTYYVSSTGEAPPKDLLASLGLKPNLGLYFFENLVPGNRKNPSGLAEDHTAPSQPPSAKPAAQREGNPRLIRPTDPLVLLDVDDH
eukprot:EG_transcript_580